MKKMLFSLCIGLLATMVSAQVPQAFKYQAVARDLSGNVLVNKTVTFKISIIQGTVTGAIVYNEMHSKTTNAFGLVEMEIGKGSSPSGNFSTINWGVDVFFVKVEMDPNGGIAFQTMGTSQLLSVPFALYSKTVETLPDNSVTNAKIVDTAVSSNKLANNSVTAPKLASMGATSGQVLTYSGTAWAPQNLPVTFDPWLASGSDIYFNTGKVGIGVIPGSSLRNFQSVTTNMQAVAGVNNSASYAAIFGENLGTGPAADFRNAIRIIDGTQGAGKVLTSDANGFTSWQTPAPAYWLYDRYLYYNGGMVGIGTAAPGAYLNILGNSSTTIPHLLLTEKEGDYSRLMFKTNSSSTKNWTIAAKSDASDANSLLNVYYQNGTLGKDLLTIAGNGKTTLNGQLGIGMSPGNEVLEIYKSDLSYLRMYNSSSGTGTSNGLLMGIAGLNAYLWNYENGSLQLGTNNSLGMIITAGGNVGIGDNSPDAGLDVEGTVSVGSGGVVFSEIKEITGTLTTGGAFSFAYPSGYNSTNIRVLSLEVNYNGTAWIGLASTVTITTDIPKLFYYLGPNIIIYYPNQSQYQNRAFRMLVMKVQ